MSLPDWLIGGVGVGMLQSAFSDLGSLGERGVQLGRELGEEQMEQAEFRPYTVTSATGSGFEAGQDGQYTLSLSPQEQAFQNMMFSSGGSTLQTPIPGQQTQEIAANRLMGSGYDLLGQPAFGVDPTRVASGQAFGLGQQFMGSSAQQPADINLLRGQFAGQVGGLLGQQPSGGIGQLGQQALGLGSAGLGAGASDVTQTFAGIQTPGVRTAAGQVAGETIGAGTAERNLNIPDVSQTFSGVQAPQIRTAAGQLAERGLGLGMAGLATNAPEDVEALRAQYGGLAGQAASGLLQPTDQREADVFERIRATQRPEEERQRLELEQRLAAQGRLGVSTAMYGGTPEQLALAKAQEESQDRASLAAIQQAQSERQQALGEAESLSGMFAGQAGLSSDLQSQAQQRAAQLSQLGLTAEQTQAQLESEGFGRELQLGQAGIQAQQAQSALRSQAQQRANQLSQLGLSAEQMQAQLESEGFSLRNAVSWRWLTSTTSPIGA